MTQQNSEILVVTLAYSVASRDIDAQAHVDSTRDHLRTAPGLLAINGYRGRSNTPYYFIFTTWEDEDSWYKAKEQYNPKQLLLTSAELFSAVPEQWVMSYIWGYTRPTADPTLTAIHLSNLPQRLGDADQNFWLQELYQYNLQTTMAFAFLACSTRDTTPTTAPRLSLPSKTMAASEKNSLHTILGLFSWAGEMAREEFYTNSHYQKIQKRLEADGTLRILPVEKL
jgi:hypothetical protein